MSLFTVAMLKNESRRFLSSALDAWTSFSDEVLILDDGSTDETREACKRSGARVFDAQVGSDPAWGQESPKRAHLWNLAWAEARVGDYILILDGDMVPAKDPRKFVESGAGAVAFMLFDIWNTKPLVYREDAYWRGHLYPRIWMVQKTRENARTEWTWSGRGMHAGHLPLNFTLPEEASLVYAPRDHALLHYAYSNEVLRDEKYISYASVSHELTTHEIEHARSIRDPDPALYTLEFTPAFTLTYQGDLG